MQQKDTTVTTAPNAITPKDPSYVSAGSQDISGTALIAPVNIMYIEILDSSVKSGSCVIGVYQMVKSCSLLSSLVSRLFPLFRL